MSRRTTAWLVPVALALAGCGGTPDQYPVSGTIRIGDKPIPAGYVTIEALDSPSATQGYAPIRDGRFDTRDGGQGAASGPVVLRIDGRGEPSERFPQGVPVCLRFEVRAELKPGPNQLELTVPESARVREPRGGWGAAP
ncbi:hypothetical protein [Gemmata sp.]|uniref:hypothetical protein n=1 Tax=Gemmata sp. TaxID=1914242 RepID=UPI003F6E6B45